jgi:hypothetical protein
MLNEPDEPSMFNEIRTVVFASPEKVGKVFRILDENLRLCLICDEVFTAQGAAEHANVACSPVPTPPPQKVARLAVSPEPARSTLRR